MTVNEIIAQVRSAIDELMNNQSAFINNTVDEANLTQVIKDKIPYAYDFCIRNASAELLANVSGTVINLGVGDVTCTIAAPFVYTVKLPSDVLRILRAKLTSWTFTPMPVSENSEEALMQTDQYAMGSYDRPVVVMSFWNNSGTINPALKMYCGRADTETASVWAIKTLTMPGDDVTDIGNLPPQLEASLIYQVAALTMVAFREEVASSLFAISRNYLGIKE